MISLLFLLASLGVFNALLLGLYLLVKKKRTTTDIYFAGLLLTLAIRIGKSVFYYFNRDADKLILQIGLSACIFIGPFFFLFLKSLIKPRLDQKKDALLLGTLLLIILIVGLLFPYREYPEWWNQYIVQGIYLVWIAFLIGGLWMAIPSFSSTSDSQKNKANRYYLLGIIVSFIFISLTYQLALFIGITYIWGALIFTFSFYYLSYRVLFNRQSVSPKPLFESYMEGQDLLQQLDEIMTSQKPYKQQGLKLQELAALAQTSKHELSKVLNDTYGKGFARYVQEYRVAEAKALIASHHHLSLEGIGNEAGFKSKSAFFEAFKKITGTTPAAFRKEQ